LQPVSSCKQLLNKQKESRLNQTDCLVGSPVFGTSNRQSNSYLQQRSLQPSFYLQPDPDIHLETFPGTQVEMDSIARLLSDEGWAEQRLVGDEASEKI
jgi:hypothetical protein